jgi:transposase
VSVLTALLNTARGLTKSYGERLRKCGTQQVRRDLGALLGAELRTALEPLLEEVETPNGRIKDYDRRIKQIAKESYPEASLPHKVKGVGTQIALTYVLTIEDPHRFRVYLWLCPEFFRPGRNPRKHHQQGGEAAPLFENAAATGST